MAPPADSPRYIGIDLGTTYSAMAWLDAHGRPVTIPNAEDELTTPSVVLFDEHGEVVVGREAKRAALIVPELVADCVKRDMGQARYHKRINYRFFSPPMISALILKKLKQDAERRIGPIAGAVVTVPAYFDERCRRATAAAGEIAGLRIIDILNEPTAAALAYAFRDFVSKGGDITGDLAGGLPRAVAAAGPHVAVVYDLGGGTFDVTVLRINGDDLSVLATDGDAKLGGRDWDERVVEWAAAAFKKQFRSDPRKDPRTLQALVLAAEEVKKDLSRLPRSRLMVNHAGQSLVLELSRDEFESVTADLLERTRERVNLVIAEAGLQWGEVNEILAVGGSSRMPMVLKMLRDVTGREPNCSLPPGEAVAHGAAIHAAIKAIDLWNIQQAGGSVEALFPPTAPLPDEEPEAALDPFSGIQGPEDEDDAVPLPHVADWDDDAPEGINGHGRPDEATRQAMLESILSGETIDLHLSTDPNGQFNPGVRETLGRVRKTDVNAHSLGVIVTRSASGRGKSILIPRNSPLPASATKVYGTMIDRQPEVVIRILEGEAEFVDDCVMLGTCRITGLPPGLPKGSPVEVTFTLDSSGRLHVRASEPTSGQTVVTTVQCDSGISADKIGRAREAMKRISVV